MSYITEWKSGSWRRKFAVGRKCDVCGRTIRGRAPAWWRLRLHPNTGPRRERLRRVRRLHVCSARCLLRKLGAANSRTRIGLRYAGPARASLRGLAFDGKGGGR